MNITFGSRVEALRIHIIREREPEKKNKKQKKVGDVGVEATKKYKRNKGFQSARDTRYEDTGK